MSSSIEVVEAQDFTRIDELATAVWENEEPGFQIDGAYDYPTLRSVLDTLETSTPASLLMRNLFYVDRQQLGTHGIKRSIHNSGHPHTDVYFNGLTVHQNVSDFIPVELATLDLVGVNYDTDDFIIDPAVSSNLRYGKTFPGRLTVFPQGSEETGTKPAIHFFDRRQATGPNQWVRYAQDRRANQAKIKKATNKAFDLIAINLEKIPLD